MDLYNQGFVNISDAGNTPQQIFDEIIEQNAVHDIIYWKARAESLAIENGILKKMIHDIVIPNEREVNEEFVPDKVEQDRVLHLPAEQKLGTNDCISPPFDPSHISHTNDHIPFQYLTFPFHTSYDPLSIFPFQNKLVKKGKSLNLLYGAGGAPSIGTMEAALQVNYNRQLSDAVYWPYIPLNS